MAPPMVQLYHNRNVNKNSLLFKVDYTSDKNHLGVTMHFNPVNAASGEYDRMEIFNQAMKSYFQ